MSTPTDVQPVTASENAESRPRGRLALVVNWRLLATAIVLFVFFVLLLAIVQLVIVIAAVVVYHP